MCLVSSFSFQTFNFLFFVYSFFYVFSRYRCYLENTVSGIVYGRCKHAPRFFLLFLINGYIVTSSISNTLWPFLYIYMYSYVCACFPSIIRDMSLRIRRFFDCRRNHSGLQWSPFLFLWQIGPGDDGTVANDGNRKSRLPLQSNHCDHFFFFFHFAVKLQLLLLIW
jgi:hypothetical protein